MKRWGCEDRRVARAGRDREDAQALGNGRGLRRGESHGARLACERPLVRLIPVGSVLRGFLWLLLLNLFGGCGGEGDRDAPEGSVQKPSLPDPETYSLEARSDDGMVVSGNPYASQAGVEMLEAGGNAADAALATAFALAVVEPSQSGLGGRTQALVGLPDGRIHGIDGTTQVPIGYNAATAPSVERGYPTVAIPGTVKALGRLLAEHGTFPLERVLVPAIRYAEGGFPITQGEARRIANVAEGLRGYESAAGYFLRPDGSPQQGGDILVQTDLAEVLRTLAREGPEAFYAGDLAQRMAEDIQINGGFVTNEDLAQYEAESAVFARGSYRGRDVVGTYLPASGATVIEILQILEHFPLDKLTEAERAAILSQALLLGFEDRDDTQFDPPVEVVAKLTSTEWAAGRAREIRLPDRWRGHTGRDQVSGLPEGRIWERPADLGGRMPGELSTPTVGPAADLGLQPATAPIPSADPERRSATAPIPSADPERRSATAPIPSADPERRSATAPIPSADPGRRSATAPTRHAPEEWPHTTHVSVADNRGMVVALTQSLGPTLGSWVVTPGLGFVDAATTGGYLADAPPGGRPWSSQAPIVVPEDGTPRYVLGGAGARRIVSALVSVVTRLVDEGEGLPEALAAPRLHPSGGRVTLEVGEGGAIDMGAVEAALGSVDL